MSEVYQKSSFHSKHSTYETYQEQRDGGSFTDTPLVVLKTWENSLTGFKNPKWRDQVKANISATTALSATEVQIEATQFFIDGYPVKRGDLLPASDDWVYGQLAGNYVPGVWSKDSVSALSEVLANNLALASYVRAVNREQRTLQGGVVIGELAEAVRMIKNPAKLLRGGLADYLHSVKKRVKLDVSLSRVNRKVRARNILDIAGGTWLEYSFGWAPLINDVDDGIRAIAESGVLSRNYSKPVRGVGVDEAIVFDVPTRLGASWPWFEMRQIDRSKVVIVYRGNVDSGSYSAYSPRRLGFSPRDWAPAVWELLPWSFLIDYFSNIGEIIAAASLAKSGLAWSNKTTVKTLTRSLIGWQPFGFPVSSSYPIVGCSAQQGKSSSVRKVVTRAPFTGSLVPDLAFSTPGSGLRWLNMASLASQSKKLSRFLFNLSH